MQSLQRPAGRSRKKERSASRCPIHYNSNKLECTARCRLRILFALDVILGGAGGRAKNAAKLHQHTAIETMTCGPTVPVCVCECPAGCISHSNLRLACSAPFRLLSLLSLYRRSAQVANQKLTRWAENDTQRCPCDAERKRSKRLVADKNTTRAFNKILQRGWGQEKVFHWFSRSGKKCRVYCPLWFRAEQNFVNTDYRVEFICAPGALNQLQELDFTSKRFFLDFPSWEIVGYYYKDGIKYGKFNTDFNYRPQNRIKNAKS